MPAIQSVSVPVESALRATVATSSFHDAYSASLSEGSLTPMEIFLATVGATPRWVSILMAIRNAVVRRIGLKDVGAMNGGLNKPAGAYQVGDRVGIFTILATSPQELLLGIDDTHLDVRVAVTKPEGADARRYVVSTVVHVHNWLGRAYMIPVGRIHPFVVRATMRGGRV